jgi:hypothetical protein
MKWHSIFMVHKYLIFFLNSLSKITQEKRISWFVNILAPSTCLKFLHPNFQTVIINNWRLRCYSLFLREEEVRVNFDGRKRGQEKNKQREKSAARWNEGVGIVMLEGWTLTATKCAIESESGWDPHGYGTRIITCSKAKKADWEKIN